MACSAASLTVGRNRVSDVSDPNLPFSVTGVALVTGWIVAIASFLWRRAGTESKATVLADAVEERLEVAQDEIKSLRNMGGDIRRDMHAEIEALTAVTRALVDVDRRSMDDIRRDAVGSTSAFAGSIALLRDQLQERGTYNAQTYASKIELVATEQRFTNGQEQIMKMLNRMEVRLDELLKIKAH